MGRVIFALFCAVLLAYGFFSAFNFASSLSQDEYTGGTRILLQQPLIGPGGQEVLATSVEISMPPGDPGVGPHIHSGPTVGYVIQGEFLFQVKGKPHQIIGAGQAFYEFESDVHVWGGNASNSTVCKITATVFGRPNEIHITFLKDYKRLESREEAIAAALQTQNAPKNASPPTDELRKKREIFN